MNVRSAVARAVVTPLAIFGSIGLAAPPALADTTPVPMTGEFLSSLPPAQTTSGVCNPEGTTTITFAVSGAAAGPYTGTFTETGTVTFGPVDIPNESAPGQFRAEVLAFSADFVIDSAIGEVTGHKELAPGAGQPVDSGNAAGCISDYNGGAITQVLTSRLTYTAQTPFGTDSGTSWVNMNTYPVPVANSSSLQFREGFSSSNGVIPQCSNGVDDDADGFIDYLADPGCSSATDGTESPNPPPPAQCSNGVDDDADGAIDYPADPGCEAATDDSESPDPGPATVTLTPPDAVNNVGTEHTVTATVDDQSGAPVAGATVLFDVEGSTTTGGSCTTDAAGQCSFTYTGPGLPGADVITGCADADGNGAVDPGEPCGTATKAWVLPATTPGQVTGGGQVANAAGTDDIAFGFNAKSDSKGVKGNCNVVDPATGTKVTCLDVTALVQSGTHATFFGRATVDGIDTTYRIDVDDNGEPGSSDTFLIQTGSGYTVGGVIEKGNIQVH